MKIIKEVVEFYSKDFDKKQIKNIIKHVLYKDVFFDDDIVTKNEIKEIRKIFKKLKKGQLLEYITNRKFFYKNNFIVNKNTLIPRPETELLVEEVLQYNLQNKNVFDICCGTGCIGLSIYLENNNINLFMSDISKKALNVTKKNIKLLNAKAKVYKSNFINFIFEKNLKPDFIIINPPYIDKRDKNLDILVKKNEPKTALFAKDNGLFFYKVLYNNLEKLFNLNKDLIILCEFGFEQKQKLEGIFNLKRVKYKIEFKKDYSNLWRYFILKKV
ncbi:peptide chain release factor N(5)-glutamine methyltransferase [Spiroplasma turonicum]|uniref:peptide chain release factor N(5)-glutamine methyltransferase n=1 Tax=Spiroplasma turonicum TaxID=216946 RepID=A0A0K1P7W2_9MOLU|nr:peptide chain release factor N(5)-glutamine methyltransferase [Spiroplasma turonicum]AKU80289.1 N5-glutamine S-adenosyl-L-methionine-dependent methyltransferase [Spiroplasma turonicum]ALX71290.1 release factor glutamine methyltransferase [Spiroplasma turonicum]